MALDILRSIGTHTRAHMLTYTCPHMCMVNIDIRFIKPFHLTLNNSSPNKLTNSKFNCLGESQDIRAW